MNLNEAIMFKNISISIPSVFILLLFSISVFCGLPHTAPISELKSNHLNCNEQPEAAERVELCFVLLASQPSTFTSEQTPSCCSAGMETFTTFMWELQSQRSIYHHRSTKWTSSHSEWQHTSFYNSFISSLTHSFSVESGWTWKVTVWQKNPGLLLSTGAEVVMDNALPLHASTPALPSFFQFTSSLSFICHWHMGDDFNGKLSLGLKDVQIFYMK